MMEIKTKNKITAAILIAVVITIYVLVVMKVTA